MSKFNSPNTIKTVNNEGHVAYSMTDKAKLITQVLTSFFNESKFYGDNSDDIKETVKKVIADDPKFVSNLAVFARREFNMRSISHILSAYLAHEVNGKPYVRSTVRGVTLRGDDATEVLSAYLNEFGKPIPNSLKKALADVFKGFNEYTLAKYKGSGKDVKMADILKLCHPKPNSREQELLWNRCLSGNLAVPETWETQLSAHGNTKETWEKLIENGSLGYMAMLRNLRNIIEANPYNLQTVLDRISNPEEVRKSKQLPFRFYSAYQVVKHLGGMKVIDALEDAIDASMSNVPRLPGKTLIAIDVSGSMSGKLSARSSTTYADISTLLGIMANRICEDSIVFQFNHALKQLCISHRDGILSSVERYSSCTGGTNMRLPFEALIDNGIYVDRIIILSDNECNSPDWRLGYNSGVTAVQTLADQYRKYTGNDVWVHAIDLEGYGTQQFNGARTNIISGWSEKVLDFILLAESGESNLEDRIENYKWNDGLS